MTRTETSPIASADLDLLVLPVRGETLPGVWAEAFGPAAAHALADARQARRPEGFRPASGPARVLVVSADAPEGADGWRFAAAAAAQAAGAVRAARVGIALPPGEGGETAAALVEGARLGAYRYERYRTAEAPPALELTLLSDGEPDGLSTAVREADVRAECAMFARDLVNRSPDEKMPDALAGLVREAAEAAGLGVSVWDEDRIRAEGFGGLLGVNRGSLDPPRVVVVEHAPPGAGGQAPLVLVGKGITYDTGGLSLKPTKDSMDKMKADMSGAAAVAGAMLAAARLALPLRVVALIPMSDNRPGGRAYVPGDVLRMHGGTTVEVLNTDAEGRLILADALSYARSLRPRLVVDVATLTGAQGVALGERVGALVVRPGAEALAEQIRAAGEASGEWVWPLPLFPHYAEALKSTVADLRNVGGPMAGTITAAAFLDHFTREPHGGEPAYDWAHLDIARPAFLDTGFGERPAGATGFGVRLLAHLMAEMARAEGASTGHPSAP